MESSHLMKMIAEKNSIGGNYFHEVASSGCVDLLRRVTPYINDSHQYLLRAVDDRGYQCVNIAAEKHEAQLAIEIIQHLISLGADINAQNMLNGDTMLHTAAHRRNHDLARWLCRQPNINVHFINLDNKTPYEVAIDNEDVAMMSILREIVATSRGFSNQWTVIVPGRKLATNTYEM
ncbi:GfV-C7-ORF1 [Ichnoviriform fumiferanae]|uniref:GfV-C7-ORF1 n=1 Tax=Ichnoviriform fumiferanae TaxID=419435 RepID=A2PZX2_9VIRU|nr:GfV-C7-ORF1 [Ichnoviriform fumiferanae]BAF45544.1 GfV-C7-ORF1 [Ichnoviriform fumiferanae]